MHFCQDEMLAIVSIVPDLPLMLGLLRQKVRRMIMIKKTNVFDELKRACSDLKKATDIFRNATDKMKCIRETQKQNISDLNAANEKMRKASLDLKEAMSKSHKICAPVDVNIFNGDKALN